MINNCTIIVEVVDQDTEYFKNASISTHDLVHSQIGVVDIPNSDE